MSSLSEAALEAEIKASGLDAPRLTPDLIDKSIKTERYYHFPGTTLTICALELQNGFHTVGHSAAASPENFNAEIGRKIARDKARERIWALEGYLLRERLSAAEKARRPAALDVVGCTGL